MKIIFPVTIKGVEVWVGFHEAAHADELGAYYLLHRFGTLKFVEIYSVEEVVNGKTYKVINVGIGLGPLDEHGGGGKKDECAMSLVARALGVYYSPPLKRIVDAICQQDNGDGDGGFLAAIIRTANDMSLKSPKRPRETLDWLSKALDTNYDTQKGLYEAEQEFPRVVRWKELVRNGKTLLMAIIYPSSRQMKDLAFKNKAAIVLQKSSTGNVQIFTNVRANISLGEVARWFQRFEQDRWYLRGKRLLLNGSERYPDVTPTDLELDYIEQIIRHYLED